MRYLWCTKVFFKGQHQKKHFTCPAPGQIPGQVELAAGEKEPGHKTHIAKQRDEKDGKTFMALDFSVYILFVALIFPLQRAVFHLHCTLPDGGVKGISIATWMGRQSRLCPTCTTIQALTLMYHSLQLTIM